MSACITIGTRNPASTHFMSHMLTGSRVRHLRKACCLTSEQTEGGMHTNNDEARVIASIWSMKAHLYPARGIGRGGELLARHLQCANFRRKRCDSDAPGHIQTRQSAKTASGEWQRGESRAAAQIEALQGWQGANTCRQLAQALAPEQPCTLVRHHCISVQLCFAPQP